MTRAGMALLRMGSTDDARILDDVDLTLTLDTRMMSSHQMTSIDITFRPIVLRASYRDIVLILTIVNKAMEAYGRQTNTAPSSEPVHPSAISTTAVRRASGGSAQSRSDSSLSSNLPLGTAQVVLSKEQVCREDFVTENILTRAPPQLKASFDGFRLILIGDLHEQPLLHLVIKSFVLSLNDWSGEVSHMCDIPFAGIDR
jgi:vacuolar protein sorting-associated protein 13A/C